MPAISKERAEARRREDAEENSGVGIRAFSFVSSPVMYLDGWCKLVSPHYGRVRNKRQPLEEFS